MSAERKIVTLSVVMSVTFGPIGIAIGHVYPSASTPHLAQWLELIAFFLVYGLVMGLVFAYAWRVENPGRSSARRRREEARRSEEYWIGDWSEVLGEVPRPDGPDDATAGQGAPRELP